MEKNGSLEEFELEDIVIEMAHITQINIINGNDDYQETDRIEVYSDYDPKNPKIKMRKPSYLRLHTMRTTNRLRGELMAEIVMESETDHKFYKISISHHKGSVHISGPVETNPVGL